MYVIAGGVCRLINRQRLAIGDALSFDEPKQMIHRIEFRTGTWQKSDLNAEHQRQIETVFGRVRRATIFKKNDPPAAPVGPNHLKEKLMSQRVPFVGNQQQEISADDIDRSVNDAFAAIARDWDTDLLPDPAITTTQRRGFGNDDLVEHQDDCPRLPPEAAFEPPFASRQFSARSASV